MTGGAGPEEDRPMAEVLAIKGSPRAGGNTDALVDEAVQGAFEMGHHVTTLALREHQFSGCVHCGGCTRDGVCHVKDAMQEVFGMLDRSEHVILGAPMFFMDVPWKVKAMIDRCDSTAALARPGATPKLSPRYSDLSRAARMPPTNNP